MADSFDEEEWFFRSVREYEELFMYDLQKAADALAWFSADSVCISCAEQGGSEIQQLGVPRKLLSSSKSDLSKDRDFKVICDGFHSRHIKEIIPDRKSRMLITSDRNSNGVTTFSLPETDTDELIRENQHFLNGTQQSESACLCVSRSTDDVVDRVAFGSHGNNLCVVNLATGQTTFNNAGSCDPRDERLCGVCWSDPDVLLVCSRYTGHISLVDTRVKAGYIPVLTGDTISAPSTWSMAVSPVNSAVHLVNTEGKSIIYLQGRQKQFTVNVRGQGQSPCPWTVKCCASEADLFSLSGMDGNVYIYNSTSSQDVITPTFTHEGHMTSLLGSDVKVTDHIWHPSIPHLLISSDNTGSLHAWKYIIR